MYKIDIEYISKCNKDNKLKVCAIIECVASPDHGLYDNTSPYSCHDRNIFKSGKNIHITKYYNFDAEGVVDLKSEVQKIISKVKDLIDARKELLSEGIIRIEYKEGDKIMREFKEPIFFGNDEAEGKVNKLVDRLGEACNITSGKQQPCHCSSEEDHKRCKEYTLVMEEEIKNIIRDILVALGYKDTVDINPIHR